MGLLGRFRKATVTPDALTRAAAARVRALPGVSTVQITGANDLSIKWTDLDEPTEIDIGHIRPKWRQANGFLRIEILDLFAHTVTPDGIQRDTSFEADTAPGPGPDPATPAPDGGAPLSEPTAFTPVVDGRADAEVPPETDSLATSAPGLPRPPILLVTRQPPDGTPNWAVAGILAAHLADPDSEKAVSGAAFAAADNRPSEARDDALRHLRASDPGLDRLGPDLEAWVVTTFEHRATWLCAPERLLEAAQLDAAVLLAPVHTEVVVVDPRDEAALGLILRNTEAILAQAEDILCPVPLWADVVGLRPWIPDSDHPFSDIVTRLSARKRQP